MTTSTAKTSGRLTDAAVLPLRTLDPDAPLDDLEWLDGVVGGARVVAIGESAHYNTEFLRLRQRVVRYLVERHGFSAFAMETGFVEGWLADDWVRGGEHDPDHVLANGITGLMGLWTPTRAHLEWMRGHNRTAARPLAFYGIDTPGSNVSLLPGLDPVLDYLDRADPGFRVEQGVRETAAAFAAGSAFDLDAVVTAYKNLPADRRDALTAGLAGLTVRLAARRLEYVQRTNVADHERAVRSLGTTVSLDAMYRELALDNHDALSFIRDAAMAATVEWILNREDRVVLAAHNGHVQRWPTALPGMAPITPLGLHLAEQLGGDYVVIGTTSGTGQTLTLGPAFYEGEIFSALAAPRPGTLDALMAASHDGPFATRLRELSPEDATAVRSVSRQRMGPLELDVDAMAAFDVVVHLPHVTAAEPDLAAIEHAPGTVREPFSRWLSRH